MFENKLKRIDQEMPEQKKERGSYVVEFALIVPVLFFLFVCDTRTRYFILGKFDDAICRSRRSSLRHYWSQ